MLRKEGAEIAATYGDPCFCRLVGFKVICQDDFLGPFLLQHPEGRLGQSLNGAPLMPLKGPAH